MLQPHRYCLFNDGTLIPLMNLGNATIAFSYFLMPLCLFVLILKKHGKLGRTTKQFILFYGMFILDCGLTHVMDIVVIYNAAYWTQLVVILVTAFVSLPVAIFTVSKMALLLTLEDNQIARDNLIR